MSLHTGTHADAAKHFRSDGASPDTADLTAFVGRALVVDLSENKPLEAITPNQFEQFRDNHPTRVLFKTNTADPTVFPDACAYFSKAAAELLAAWKVKLVGIDTPSVDQLQSKSLDAHHLFDRAGIAILENLMLRDVTAGWYELIALPLKLVGMDASPVRAVLRTLD